MTLERSNVSTSTNPKHISFNKIHSPRHLPHYRFLRLSHRHHLRQSLQLFPIQRDQFRAKPQSDRGVDRVTAAQAVVRGNLTRKRGNGFIYLYKSGIWKTS